MQHDIKNVYSIQKYVHVFQKNMDKCSRCVKNAHVIQQNKYCLSEKCT